METTTSHFDDFAARPNAIRKKVQRPICFGRKSDGYSTEIGPPRFSSKSVANQSRPMSLQNTKNTSLIDDAELTSLDFNNRNSRYMLEPVTGNDNDGCCQRLHYANMKLKVKEMIVLHQELQCQLLYRNVTWINGRDVSGL